MKGIAKRENVSIEMDKYLASLENKKGIKPKSAVCLARNYYIFNQVPQIASVLVSLKKQSFYFTVVFPQTFNLNVHFDHSRRNV